MAAPLAHRIANTIRAAVRLTGYELTKTFRMHELLDRQQTLLELAAKGLEPAAGKGKAPVAEGIIWSKDRPLQLHMLLRSYLDNVSNRVPLHVIYYASTPAFAKAFDEVAACFKGEDFTFVKEERFKPTLLKTLDAVRADKVFFLSDDDVYINSLDMAKYASVDVKEAVLNLVLSPQVTHSYTTQSEVRRPVFVNVKDRADLKEFKWGPGPDMWGYPMMVDGTLWDTREMRLMARLGNYKAPNSFEGALMEFAHGYRKRKGYCYNKVMLMNFPLNKVQSENNNYGGGSGVEQLLATWNEGLMIDPTPYYGMDFTGFKTKEPLDEVPLKLVPRSTAKKAKAA